MWILILLIVVTGHDISTEQVTGFSSKETCEAVGKRIQNERWPFNGLKGVVQTGFSRETRQLNNLPASIYTGYECIEVK